MRRGLLSATTIINREECREAVVDGGEVRLPETVKLPEHAKVYVVVPGVEEMPPFTIHTPHLLRPEHAADFTMEIVEGEDAAVR